MLRSLWLKRSALSAATAVVLMLLPGCPEENKTKPVITELATMNAPEYTIGVPQGAAAMTLVEQRYPKSKILYFQSLADGYAAVEYGKIDAFAFDRHAMKFLVSHNPKLALSPESLAVEPIVIAAAFGQEKLLAEVNEFISRYRADGTYQDMYRRWLEGTNLEMPEIPEPANPTRTLKIGTEGLNVPLNYFGKNGKPTGFDVEFARRLGLFLNAKIEIATMTFDALLLGTETGKLDLLIANLNGTPERSQNMLMSAAYIDSDITFLLRKERLGPTSAEARLSDFHHKRVASMTGGLFPQFVNSVLNGVTHLPFNDYPSMIEALRSNKVDAIAVDEPVGQMLVAECSDLMVLPEMLADDSYGLAMRKKDPRLAAISGVIERFQQDGTIQKVRDNWFSAKKDKQLPKLNYKPDFNGAAGELILGHDIETPPMSYMAGSQPQGFDLELVTRVAYELNMQIKYVPMNFGSLIAALRAGKVDIVCGCMSVTEERKKSVDFTPPYYRGGIALVIRRPENAPAAVSKWKNSKDLASRGRGGVMTGSMGELLLEQRYRNKTISTFDSFADAVPALNGDKLDFVIGSYTSLLHYAKAHPEELAMLPEQFSEEGNAIALKKGNVRLRDKINAVLKKFAADGTLKELEKRWISVENIVYQRKIIPFRPDAPVLKVAIAADREPICFVMDGAYVGFDCELIERIAAELGMRVEYQNMKFSGLISSLHAGKSDLAISNLSWTEERARSVEFTDLYYSNPQSMLVRRATLASLHPELAPAIGPADQEQSGILTSLAGSFRRTFLVENRYLLVLNGLWITILISVLAAFFGTILGFGICLARRAKSRWLNWPARVYIGALQGMPVVVLLMILYYVVFGSVDISAVLVAVVGFALNFSANVSEMMRTGIDAMDKGQLEAAEAMGFGRCRIFAKIIFPQATRHVLPVYKGEFINMLKMTSVVGYIAIQDLTKMSDIIRSRTYEAFFPLLSTALLYFLISYVLMLLLSLLEWRIDPKHRKRVVKGVQCK